MTVSDGHSHHPACLDRVPNSNLATRRAGRFGKNRAVHFRAESKLNRPQRARQSPLNRTIERYLPEFERTYAQRYARRYGPWRPIIGHVARRLLRCDDLLHFGFARVRCPDCRHEMFVAFSCQQRCLCPSCHQNRTLLAAENIARTICAPVPHRQRYLTPF